MAGDSAPEEMTRVAAHQASLLVHEATFGADAVERAAETAHSTAGAAAELAASAEVGLLALTHLSLRYAGPEVKDEPRRIFDRTIVRRDYDRVEIQFPERGEPVPARVGDDRPRRSAC